MSDAKQQAEKPFDDIITLCAADGEEIDFTVIAGIARRGSFYLIMQPCELPEGMSDTEALVFKRTRGKDGTDHFDIELDDEIIGEVFEEYYKMCDEAEQE